MSPNAVHAAPSDFQVANPHALATILEASETRSIIASSDSAQLAYLTSLKLRKMTGCAPMWASTSAPADRTRRPWNSAA